jgi:hypothetical protein
MKLITSLISTVALSFATFALAQEQETPSPASEQKASAAVEQTTTPAPEAAATTTTSEQPVTQKKETTAGSAPNQKRAGSAKVSPAGVAATASSRKGSAEATLRTTKTDGKHLTQLTIAQLLNHSSPATSTASIGMGE